MKRVLKLVFLVGILLSFLLITSNLGEALKLIPAQVVRVIDGDTIEAKFGNRIEKIRFIGVNCPESTIRVEPYGKEASNFTKKWLSNRKIYLELDVQTYDKYGRLLAYIWLSQPKDTSEKEIRNKMFNAILLLYGYAQVMTVPPNVKYVDYFLKFQREAREKGVGLWKTTQSQTTTIVKPETTTVIVYITRTGNKYHRLGCRYLRKSCIPISLEEAKARGYTPCSVCNPPR
jgi:micrococcal nuclease